MANRKYMLFVVETDDDVVIGDGLLFGADHSHACKVKNLEEANNSPYVMVALNNAPAGSDIQVAFVRAPYDACEQDEAGILAEHSE